MDKTEIVGLIVTLLGVGCFSIVFTILYMSYVNSEVKAIRSGKRDLDVIDEKVYESLSHVKTRRKITETIKSIVFYGLMIFMIPLFIFSIINKLQNNVTLIGNRAVLAVASGSMSVKHEDNTYLANYNNQFDKFDIIVIQKVANPYELQMYDVIAFVNDEGDTIIHRIVDITINSEGKIQYTTRGDSNGRDAVDKFRPTIDDIHGKYINKRIPLVGMFILFVQSSLGLVTVVALAYCLIMIDRLTSKITKEQDSRFEKLNSALEINHDEGTRNMKAEYVESIHYDGYVYMFNEEGFIGKMKAECENTELDTEKHLDEIDSNDNSPLGESGLSNDDIDSEVQKNKENINNESDGD